MHKTESSNLGSVSIGGTIFSFDQETAIGR